MFWSKQTAPTPDDLSQEWILDGFKKSIDGFFILQGDSFGNADSASPQEDLLYISPNFLHLAGYQNAEDHINDLDWWREKIHPEDRNRVINYMRARRLGKTEQKQIEYRFHHRAGHWIWLLVQTHVYHPPLSDDPNQNGWIMGVITNISSFRVLQDQLERTIEEAEQTSQAKSKFIASLNHELRTPLNGILGMTNFLKDAPLSSDQLGYVNNIAASAQLLLTLVNDILDVSKITAGKLDLEEHPFNLDQLLQRTSGLLKPLAQLKKLDLDLSFDANVPKWVIGDQVRLQQIITNLVNNAIKFTETGKITITVQLRNTPASDPDKVLVLFKVIDTGSGIPADVLPKLFQDFTQASSSVTRTHGGTGLGLSICKKLISLMRGEIGVQSTLGKGSTFWFSIPYEPTEAEEENLQETKAPRDISKTRILVAEDNLINQQVIKGLIQNLGGDVTIAQNGQEAIDQYDQSYRDGNPFHIIFMDINMPILDGYGATQALRSKPEAPDLAIIACTADTITHNRDDFLQKGFTDVVPKPINKQDLFEMIQKYGQEGNEPNESTSPLPSPEPNCPPQEEETLINPKVIETLKEDIGADVLDSLLITYKTDAKQIIDQLVEDQTLQETHNLAHALAGISENLGIQAVGKLSRSLMIITHEMTKNNPDANRDENAEITTVIAQLQTQFAESVKAIDAL